MKDFRRHGRVTADPMKKLLLELGLSEREVEAYLALVRAGSSPASLIARELKIPRQTVHSILEKLAQEGIVEKSDRFGVRHFFADPNDLILVLDRRKARLERQKQELQKELPQLLGLQNEKKALPRVRYFEGEEGLKQLFDHIIQFYVKGGEKMFRGYGINKLDAHLGGYLRDLIERRGKLGVTTHLFIAKGDDDFHITDAESALGRTVKRLDMPEQEAAMYLVGDRVYHFSYRDNVGVVVENKSIASILKATFDAQWQATLG